MAINKTYWQTTASISVLNLETCTGSISWITNRQTKAFMAAGTCLIRRQRIGWQRQRQRQRQRSAGAVDGIARTS